MVKAIEAIIVTVCAEPRDGSRAAATSKVELLVIIVNDLAVEAVLDLQMLQ